MFELKNETSYRQNAQKGLHTPACGPVYNTDVFLGNRGVNRWNVYAPGQPLIGIA
jgi:hypothetical protein